MLLLHVCRRRPAGDTTASCMGHIPATLALLRVLQGERRQQAGELLSTLEGLWHMLEVDPDDVDRTTHASALRHPGPIHRRTLDEVCMPSG